MEAVGGRQTEGRRKAMRKKWTRRSEEKKEREGEWRKNKGIGGGGGAVASLRTRGDI